MLKKALACASVAAVITGGAAALAPAASASDVVGGRSSQNVSVLPHTCVDAKRLVQLDLITTTPGLQCNEDSGVVDSHKAPLADLVDLGSSQN
ncbi:hypothetical protein RKE29_17040 [Streptomyces sp. B1866]|uniref:hypothetical protein n=1 Tax=Streptomyces sp. B1866 TaxID=3075431 RepID=UPI0028926712|nr:hypothetical protein [Streptomyces sp. B1866]MDT3398331.1 hypothetical protein [Streptomyces sp. B1866]